MSVKERVWGNNQNVGFFFVVYVYNECYGVGESLLELPFIQVFIHKEFDHTLDL